MRRSTSQSTAIKWRVLEHKGPVFPPPYERLPDGVNFKYDGEVMGLTEISEEVMTYFAKCDKKFRKEMKFKKNFFRDWRKIMSEQERSKITVFQKCNFYEVTEYFEDERQNDKNKKKEETQKSKRLGYDECTWNGRKEKIGNFRVEQPGLFIPTNENHPQRGKLKRRLTPEDVVINCSGQGPNPPGGHNWKKIVQKNTVTWLASWEDDVQRKPKYIKLSPVSSIKGEDDRKKYDAARVLKSKIRQIRDDYKKEMTDDDVMVRQRAVALYFIDRLALRPGKKIKEVKGSDTVGCCSLRCNDIELLEREDNGRHEVEFNFRGKGGVRYERDMRVSEQVFTNLSEFIEDKEETDYLFDKLTISELNKHLKENYDTTAKVLRTFRASSIFQAKLLKSTKADDSEENLVESHQTANFEVAKLCNHRRNIQAEGAKYATETSKEHYIDPRITVAWCKKYNVPKEKIFKKFQLKKFAWAMEIDESYEF